jgi:hypothetical protein
MKVCLNCDFGRINGGLIRCWEGEHRLVDAVPKKGDREMSFQYRLSIKIEVPLRRLKNLSLGRISLKLTKKEWGLMAKVKDAMWDIRFEVNGDFYTLHCIEDDARGDIPTLILK